uniref:Uncharacterized protein n=1 Tax=Candidatus Kentrum sp. SD TaxID=2126332 RepID=A0A450YUV0_9GAMM|nr:MAG: hypothetical protein BECKSD772F_GA0070984_104824 [Candidatus Kentron sp. SD]VFK45331.1 MAG: hypothetical protein BECKSD772E_GA0070983_105123 [Candidatus Kentron sp. SD]
MGSEEMIVAGISLRLDRATTLTSNHPGAAYSARGFHPKWLLPFANELHGPVRSCPPGNS